MRTLAGFVSMRVSHVAQFSECNNTKNVSHSMSRNSLCNGNFFFFDWTISADQFLVESMAVCRSEVTSQSHDVNKHCDGFKNLWTRSVVTCKQMSDYLINM